MESYENYEQENRKRKVRIEKDNGEIEYVDLPITHQTPKILHPVLHQDIIEKIGKIYADIKDVLQGTTNPPMNLESFELAFMGDVDPIKSLEKWQKIVRVYKKAQVSMGSDFESRKTIYSVLLYHSMGSLLPAEKEQEGVQFLMKLYDSSK